MNEQDLDALVATADVKPAQVKETPSPVAEKPATAPAVDTAAPAENQDASEGDENQPNDDVKTPWPKSAVNAMRRRDNKLTKREEALRDYQTKLSDPKFLQEQLTKLNGGNAAAVNQPANPADPEPDLGKYDDWGKYNKDLTAWNVRQLTKGQTETKQSQEQQKWVAERTETAVSQVKELLTSNPEFAQVFQQNADVIDDFPEAIKNSLLKSDNAALATVVLAQDGLLEDLGEMSPALAERTIARAILRGQKLIAKSEEEAEPENAHQQAPQQPAKKVSAAPAPMTPSKTVVAGKRAPDKMSDAEFRKEFLVG